MNIYYFFSKKKYLFGVLGGGGGVINVSYLIASSFERMVVEVQYIIYFISLSLLFSSIIVLSSEFARC